MRLRRSDLTRPGIERHPTRTGWRYTQHGRPVGKDDRTRADALVLPPAWTDVWIAPYANGHIQAVGTDAAGRRQYRYHEAWTQSRAEGKFDRVLDAARVLPSVREKCLKALDSEGLTKDRVLACAVRLLELGFFRVGGEQYVETNGSFGLATIERRHVSIDGDRVEFDYLAKSGKQRHAAVVDPLVVQCVTELKNRRERKVKDLLAWQDEDGWHDVTADDINASLRELADHVDLTAKDFRTWSATVLCGVALAVSTRADDSPTARKRAVARAVAETAHYLGNTPAVCRRSYIHPRLLDLYDDGVTIADELEALGAGAATGDLAYQGTIEKAVLEMLTDPLAAKRRAAKHKGKKSLLLAA